MKSRFLLLLGVVLMLLTGAFPGRAQESGDGTLHVLRPIVHAEQDAAELCLEFDHPLVKGDHTKIDANIKLESGGRNLAVTKSMNVSGSQLCLPELEHRKDYHLTLISLRGAGGEKLANAYSLSFTVPARHPVLTFLEPANDNGVMHWQDANPVLRAVNVDKAKLELFRITDPARMAEAWNTRLQTALAPSESATFARNSGTLVWQGNLAFEKTSDKYTEQAIPIDVAAQKIPPGLYLIVASAPELRRKATDLAPIAAAWLVRSTLRIQALRDVHAVIATAEKADAALPQKDVHFFVVGHDQKTLAEGNSDADGLAALALPDNKMNDATLLVGLGPDGDVAFLDLPQGLQNSYMLPSVETKITLTQAAYAPADRAEAILTARDLHNRLVAIKAGTLQLQRPDHSVYAAYPVPDEPLGVVHIMLPTPVMEGAWPLVWHSADGTALAESVLRVSSNPDAPHLDMSADRALLKSDGEVNLTLHSVSASGASVPYIAGEIDAVWSVPDHLFPDWPNYHFGTGAESKASHVVAAHFVTDGKGVTHIHLNLTPPDDGALLHAVTLRGAGDAVAGVLDTADIVLPVQPKDIIVGLKPAVAGGRFPENSLAHFDIVALNSEGKRTAIEGLTYHVYEAGRSFDWYQSEGHWEFKQLQQQRRIGGGPLTLTEDGAGSIEWPVTAGAYRLEINDADGDQLASMDFSAGWGVAVSEQQAPVRLVLKPSAPVVTAGQEMKIAFTLPRPSIVTVLVADDHIRKIIHISKPQGDNTIAFMPAADWGNHLRVHIDALPADADEKAVHAAGEIVFPVSSSDIAQPPATTKPPPAFKVVNNEHDDVGFLRETLHQELAPQHTWAMPVDKGHAHLSPRVLLAGAEPLYNLLSILPTMLDYHPFTTGDLARQFKRLHQWRDVIVGTGMMTESSLHHRQDNLLIRLMARQQADGSFAASPSAQGDLAATINALTVLAVSDQAIVQPALIQAANWVKHRLENSWFDEHERPSRAAAYAALAEIGQIDSASLHYFADASADKSLPPLAALQLSFAFSKVQDKDKALFWINAAHINLGSPDLPAAYLPVLAANLFVDPHALLPALQKLSDLLAGKPRDFVNQIIFLRTLEDVQSRAGSWQASINGSDRKNGNVIAIPLPASFRNLSQRILYLAVAEPAKHASLPVTLTRRIYRPDGGEVTGDLERNGIYVVVLEGPWPTNTKSPLYVHDDIGPALIPVSCALQGAGGEGFLIWLSDITPTISCEGNGSNIDAVIDHTNDTGPTWRIAYLARAEYAGSFDLNALRAYALPDGSAMGGRKQHMQVR